VKYQVELDGQEHLVEIESTTGGWLVAVDDGEQQLVSGSARDGGAWTLNIGGRVIRLGAALTGSDYFAVVGGTPMRGSVIDPRKAALDMSGGRAAGEVRTQMPGAIVRVDVEEGQEVEAGQVLLVVEAMKMQNEFKAPISGTVIGIHVDVGAAVESGTLLITVSEAE